MYQFTQENVIQDHSDIASRAPGCEGTELFFVWSEKRKEQKEHQIWSNFIATSHDRKPPKWWFSKGNGTPYFREIQVGEIL